MPDPTRSLPLVGRRNESVTGHISYDPREDEWPEAFAFCPACAEREFGGRVALLA